MSDLDLNAIVKNASGQELSEIEPNQDVYTSNAYKGQEGNMGGSSIKWTPFLAERSSEAVDDNEPWLYRLTTSDPNYTFKAFGFKNRPEEPSYLQPYQKDAEGELVTFNVNGIGGYIVDLESGASLGYYDSENRRPVTKCQVTGCSSMLKDHEGRPYNVLPRIPFGGSMFGFDKSKGGSDYNTPSRPVMSIDPVGSRGEKCVDCIRRGHATQPHEDGEIQCTPNGYLYIVVKELLQTKKQVDKDGISITKVSKRKKVEDLTDEEGNPLKSFICAVKLTRTSSGGWNSDMRLRTMGIQYFTLNIGDTFKSNPLDSKGNGRKDDIRYWPIEVFSRTHYSNSGNVSPRLKLHIQLKKDALMFQAPPVDRASEMSRLSKLEIDPKDLTEREEARKLWEELRPSVEIRPLEDKEFKSNLDSDTKLKSADDFTTSEESSNATKEDEHEFWDISL